MSVAYMCPFDKVVHITGGIQTLCAEEMSLKVPSVQGWSFWQQSCHYTKYLGCFPMLTDMKAGPTNA